MLFRAEQNLPIASLADFSWASGKQLAAHLLFATHDLINQSSLGLQIACDWPKPSDIGTTTACSNRP